MIKIFAVFNYKGGVAKTTTAINVATKIAMNGKRVILVDADPQCNLTSFFTKTESNEEEDGAAAADEANQNDELGDDMGQDEAPSDFEDGDEGANGEDFHSAEFPSTCFHRTTNSLDQLDWVADDYGRRRRDVNVQVNQDIIREGNDNLLVSKKSPNDLYRMLQPIFGGTFTAEAEENFELVNLGRHDPKLHYMSKMYLLPGSVFISEFEEQLTDNVNELHVRCRGSFRRLLRKLALKYVAEYVIVDFSPSSGNMNKAFIMSCDYILPVAKADEFSCSSAEALMFKLLDAWFEYGARVRSGEKSKYASSGRANEDLREFFFKRENPGILPFLVTAYKLYTPPKKKASSCAKKSTAKARPSISSASETRIAMIGKGVVKATATAIATAPSPAPGRPQKPMCTTGCSYWIRQLQAILSDKRIPPQVYRQMISFNNELVIPIIPELGHLVGLSSEHSIPIPSLKAIPQSGTAKWGKEKIDLVNKRLHGLYKALEQLPGFAR